MSQLRYEVTCPHCMKVVAARLKAFGYQPVYHKRDELVPGLCGFNGWRAVPCEGRLMFVSPSEARRRRQRS